MRLLKNILIATILTSMCVVSIGAEPPDRNNPLVGLYSGKLKDHLTWCDAMHIGYSKDRLKHLVIPHLNSQNEQQDKQLSKLIYNIENSFSTTKILPLISLSLGRTATTEALSPEDVATFFDQHEPTIDGWFQTLTHRLNTLNTPYDLKPRRFRFEYEANVYRYVGRPVVYYETTRNLHRIFTSHLSDSILFISIASLETFHATDYLRPLLEYHRDTYPNDPLPFDGIQFTCNSREYMHSVKVYHCIQALFCDVFGAKKGMDHFNRQVFWSNTLFALGMATTPGVLYATDAERARQDIKSITQFLSLPNAIMINVDRRLEGDRNPKSKNSYHNLNGLEQNGCGLFDRGKGFISPAQESLELFTRYIHTYRPTFNNTTSTVRVFDFVQRSDSKKHRLLIWREFGDEKVIETIRVPEEWMGLKEVWVINLITLEKRSVPFDSQKLEFRMVVDDNPVLITPEK